VQRRSRSKNSRGPEDGEAAPDAAAADDPAVVRGRALRLLARREHSARELRYKLEQRGVEPETAANVVDELGRSGWQSDARYVESFVRNRVAQGYGPLRIEAELAAAGVARDLVRGSLDAVAVDWKQLAVDVRERKFGAAPAAAAEWQKQYRHLAGRGFDSAQIRAALRDEPPEA
jgi:regulatory protein